MEVFPRIVFQYIFVTILVIFLFSGCSKRDAYKEQTAGILEEWDDALAIASSTSKIALSQPVSKLQKIHLKYLAFYHNPLMIKLWITKPVII